MKRLAVVAFILATAPALAQQATPSPDVAALQQMFADSQAGEFSALRRAAQLKIENTEQAAEIVRLKAENEKLRQPEASVRSDHGKTP